MLADLGTNCSTSQPTISLLSLRVVEERSRNRNNQNRGVAKAMTLEFANQGENIVIDYVSHPEATEKLEQQIVVLADQAMGVPANVSRASDLHRMIETAVAKLGRVDVMVNNASIEPPVLDTTEAQYDKGIDINLKPPFFGPHQSCDCYGNYPGTAGCNFRIGPTIFAGVGCQDGAPADRYPRW